jgi:uncharacterized membrane protein YqgA involved in biofilm formation
VRKNKASPNPNIVNPNISMNILKGVSFQRWSDVQGVLGIVRAGRRISPKRLKKFASDIVRIYHHTMFIGLGSVINAITIVIGASLGIAFGAKLRDHTRELIMSSLGLITACAAADMVKVIWSSDYQGALPKGWPIIAILVALILGGLIGSALQLEKRLEGVGSKLKETFKAKGDSNFIEGFVMASLIFVVGPMAILGGISDGMRTGIQTLVLKSILDGIAAMAFAATLGWGVAASAIPTAVYQLIWTALGWSLGSILNGYQVAAITATGGLLIFCISLRLLKIKTIAIGDLLPALFIAPVIVFGLNQFIA